MKCFKGCGFLLKEVTYYKELAILLQWLDAESPTSKFSQTSLPSHWGSHQPGQPAHATSSHPRNIIKMLSQK